MAIYVNGVLVAGNGENGAPATINGVNALNIEATGGLSGRQSGDTYTIDGSGLVPKTTTVNGKPPSGYPDGWTDLGTVEDVQGAI